MVTENFIVTNKYLKKKNCFTKYITQSVFTIIQYKKLYMYKKKNFNHFLEPEILKSLFSEHQLPSLSTEMIDRVGNWPEDTGRQSKELK